MIDVYLNKDDSIEKIDYPHYGTDSIKKEDLPRLKENLKEINLEVRQIQKIAKVFKSDDQLKDEILCAQLKYISGIKLVGRIKRPSRFQFHLNPPSSILYTRVYVDTGRCEHSIRECQNDADKDDLYFERMTLDEFGYYMSWRTKILNHKPVRYEDELSLILEKELIFGTIDNSGDMLKYLMTVFGDYTSVFKRYYEDMQKIKSDMKAYVDEKKRKAEVWDHFVPNHEYYNCNFEYKYNGYESVCEYIRMGTGFSLLDSLYRKYKEQDLKRIFIEIFDLAIIDIATWVIDKGIPFGEVFIANKQPYKFFCGNASQEIISRLYNTYDNFFTYVENRGTREFRRMLLYLIDNSVRKCIQFKESNKVYDQINICKNYLPKENQEKILIDLVDFTNELVEQIAFSKYSSVFMYMRGIQTSKGKRPGRIKEK